MVEPVSDNILNLVNELYNNLDAKDKIINEQALEIANLNKRLENEQKVVEEYLKLEDDYELLYNDLDNANSKLSDLMKSHLEAIESIKNIKQHYEELKKAPFEDSVFINDMLRQSFILSIESYLDLFLEILGDRDEYNK